MKQLLKLLTLLLAAVLLVGCKAEEPDFTREEGPDFTKDITWHFNREFAQLLEEKRYIPDARKITWADVKDITDLDVSGPVAHKFGNPNSYIYFGNLTSLSGIEYFSALTNLYCHGNKLKTLDVSKNMNLTSLGCSHNQLTTLNVRKNTALNWLYCPHNQLTSLNISNNTALKWLNCFCNPGNGTVFPVTAWFNNNNIPSGFITEGWDFDGSKIDIKYIKK